MKKPDSITCSECKTEPARFLNLYNGPKRQAHCEKCWPTSNLNATLVSIDLSDRIFDDEEVLRVFSDTQRDAYFRSSVGTGAIRQRVISWWVWFGAKEWHSDLTANTMELN